jgi:hypothetical protein
MTAVSPQSNGMAEAFVRTIKRDYVRVSPRPDAESVLRQLPAWIAQFTRTRLCVIVHPVSSLQLTKDPDRVRSFGGYNTFHVGNVFDLEANADMQALLSAGQFICSAWAEDRVPAALPVPPNLAYPAASEITFNGAILAITANTVHLAAEYQQIALPI